MKMQIRHIVFAALVLGLVSMANAVPTLKVEGGPYQAIPGGEFTATVMSVGILGHGVGSSFQTFCLETDEYLSLGSTYDASINTAAVAGGSGGPSPDPLDPKTAYLYSEFVKGTLTGYFTNPLGRKDSAGALQKAIWYIEEEIAGPLTGLAKTFYDDAALNAGPDIGSVRVLNLQTAAGEKKQDVLVDTVPVPAALGLGVLGAAMLAISRKRMGYRYMG